MPYNQQSLLSGYTYDEHERAINANVRAQTCMWIPMEDWLMITVTQLASIQLVMVLHTGTVRTRNDASQ